MLMAAWRGMTMPVAPAPAPALALTLWAAMWLVIAAIRGNTGIRVNTAIPVSAPTPSDAEQVALMRKVKRPAVLASGTAARSCPWAMLPMPARAVPTTASTTSVWPTMRGLLRSRARRWAGGAWCNGSCWR